MMDKEYSRKTSWEEQYRSMKGKIIGQLRAEGTKGNPIALVVLAEKYMDSANPSEIGEGFRMLEEAEDLLRAGLSREDAGISKDALVYLFNLKGEKLEEKYQQTGDDALLETIFRAYSNANELDPTQVDGIARCYEIGIGVEKDEYKARAYKDQKASRGGIESKFEIGRQAYDSSEHLRAAEWLQNALLSEDAEEHRALKHCARVLLGRIHETDERGEHIDAEQEYNRLLLMMKNDHNSEAAYCLAMLAESEDEKLCYFGLGMTGTPEQYASLCARSAEQVRKKAQEQEKLQRIAEERRRQEELKRRAEEEARRERQRQEELRRRAEEERLEQQRQNELRRKEQERLRKRRWQQERWENVSFATVGNWINQYGGSIEIESIVAYARYDTKGIIFTNRVWYFTHFSIRYYPNESGHKYKWTWMSAYDGFLSSGLRKIEKHIGSAMKNPKKVLLNLRNSAHYSGGGGSQIHVGFAIWEE